MTGPEQRQTPPMPRPSSAGLLHRYPLTAAVVALTPAASLLTEVLRRSLG
jgi:hypothetical protein